MTEAKIAGALGLCRRAGKIVVGAYLVKEEIRMGRAAIVLLASDAGMDVEKKLEKAASEKGIETRRIVLTKVQLAQALGKRGEAVCVAIPREFLNLVLASL